MDNKTYRRYQEGLDHFQRYAGAQTSKRVALATAKVKGFRPFRRTENAAKATVNNDLAAVSILATHCVDQGWIEQRPKIKNYKTVVRIRYLEPA